ncbi:MAG: outer membrane beta-barrel protein [Psychromonas sp.]|nr:outer membrane beta-barrel protein [Psychromonas sp.]
MNSYLTYTENDAATQLNTDAILWDGNGSGNANWYGGTLVAQITANYEISDELSIPDNVVGSINTNGSDLRDNTTVIGTLSASEGTVSGGTALTITFNTNVTNLLVQQVLRAIHYRNSSEAPGTVDRTITYTATNKYAASASDTLTVAVVRVYPPVFTSSPITNATEDVAYGYALQAEATQNASFSVKQTTTLPSWLSLQSASIEDIGSAIDKPGGIAIDAQGNTYVAEIISTNIYKITPAGVQTVWANVSASEKYAMLVSGEYLYISYFEADKITRIALNNPDAGESDYITSITSPLAMIEKDGFIYVPQYDLDKISKIDLSDASVTDYVTGTPGPFGLGFDSSGALFIANVDNKFISKFANGVLTPNIKTFSLEVTDIKIDAADNIYVSTFGQGVKKISKDLSTTQNISTQGAVFGMTLDNRGTLSWGVFDQNKVVQHTIAMLNGTPSNDDVGSHDLCITATAVGLSSDQCFTINVANTNDDPIITGSPETVVAEGVNYSFTPEVTDVDSGDTKTFTISNQPAWASFDTTTGTLTGIPDDLHVGTTAAIVISVKDSANATASIAPFNIQVTNVNIPPSISGTPDTTVAEGASYSFTPSVSDPDSGDSKLFSIVNQPSWASFDTATGALTGSPTNAHVGTTSAIVITVKDSGNETDSLTAFNLQVTNINDAVTGSVTISGTVAQDSELTAINTLADNDGLGNFTYQWKANNVNVGTDATTYTPTDSDVGKTITVTISYTDLQGTAESKASSATAAVTNVNDAVTGTVTISGTVAEDSVLTANNTLADNDGLGDFTYQWKANNENVGTDATTYTPTDSDVGKTITVTISYTDLRGTAESKTSAVTVAVTNINDAVTGSVAISGTVAKESVLTATNNLADVDGIGELSYQWYANGVEINDATTDTYTLTADEINKVITVKVSYTDQNGTLESKVSAATVAVVNTNDAPIISGTPSTSVEVLSSYSFIPTLTDSLDTATFEITNKPSWANFDSATGALTGIPAESDIGSTNAIVISVMDASQAKSELPAFNLTVTAIDKTPSLSGIEIIEVNATALLTDVNLGDVTAESYLNESIEAIKPNSFLAPGEHTVVWKAIDADGNEVSENQIVKVHPLISLGKDSYVKQGAAYQFEVHLNGEAPSYPITVPYAVYGDDNIQIGSIQSVTFTEQNKIDALFTISEAMTTDYSLLTIELNPENSVNGLNLDAKSSLILTRIEKNIAPKIGLSVEQDGQLRTQIINDANAVTITANTEDSNKDELTVVWSSEDNALFNNSSDQTLFTFDAQGLEAGIYKVSATVTEVGTAELYSNTQDVYINVGAVLPDYITQPNTNVLPDNTIAHKASDGNKYLLEAEPGTTVTFGRLSLQESLGGAQVSTTTIENDNSIELDATENVNVGGLFDFEIHNLPVSGQSVKMVLPLREAIPEEAIYRKYITNIGWTDFVEDSNNELYSATGQDGYCPPPSSSEYTQGLTVGNWCVRLTIEDGGPNDDDGIANGTIVDPGGITMKSAVSPEDPEIVTPESTSTVKNSSGGGSTGILTLLGLALVAVRRYAKKLSVILLSIISVNSQASEWFIDIDMGYSKADKGVRVSDAENMVSIDDSDTSWSLGLGYHVTDRWSVATRYIDLGEGRAELAKSNTTTHAAVSDVTPILAQGFAIDTSYRFYQRQAFSSFITVGGFAWRSDLKSELDGNTIKHTDRGTDLYTGLSVAYDISDKWQTAITYKRYFLDVNNVDNVSLKLIYLF